MPERTAAPDQAPTSPYFLPGFLLRRGQQVHHALWTDIVPDSLTSRQFAILRFLSDHPGSDQITIGQGTALDRSNTPEILSRLSARRLVRQEMDPVDRRRRIWTLTPEGDALFRQMVPYVTEVSSTLTASLTPDEREELMRLLQLVVDRSDDVIREYRDPTRSS